MAGRTNAEAAARDAEEIATEATRHLMVAVDDVLNPLVELMDKIGNAGLPCATKTQYRGSATNRAAMPG